MAEFIDYTEIEQYRDRINRQYGRCSGPNERVMHYPQIVSYIDSRNTKRERRRSRSRSRSRSRKRNKDPDQNPEPEPSNEVEINDKDNDIVEGAVEGVESLLRKKSRSKVCDEFGNLVNKIDYAIYDGEEFQQEKSDTKSLFQRVDERDSSMGKTTVISLDTPKRKKKCLSVPRSKTNHPNVSEPTPTQAVEGQSKNNENTKEYINSESGLNTNEPTKRGMSAITKKLIEGSDTGSNSCNPNTADGAGNEYSNSKKIHARVESSRNTYESPTESVRNRMKSPRKPVVDINEDINSAMGVLEKVPKLRDSDTNEHFPPIYSRLPKGSEMEPIQDSNLNNSPNMENSHKPLILIPPPIPRDHRKSKRRKKKHKKKSKAKTLFDLGNPSPNVYCSDSDSETKKRKKKSKREKGSCFSPTSSVSSGQTVVDAPSDKVCNKSSSKDSDQSFSDGSFSDASTDESDKAEAPGCHRSKSESSVCESISTRPRKRYKEHFKHSGFGIFRNNRSISEGRGLLNTLSQTVGNCLTSIAMNHGRYSFPSRQQLYVPDLGLGRNWLRNKPEAMQFFSKKPGPCPRVEKVPTTPLHEDDESRVQTTPIIGQASAARIEAMSAQGETFGIADMEISTAAGQRPSGESVKLHKKGDSFDYQEFRHSMDKTIMSKSPQNVKAVKSCSPITTDDPDANRSFNKASTQVMLSYSSDEERFSSFNRRHQKGKLAGQLAEYKTGRPRKARSRHTRKPSSDDESQYSTRDLDPRERRQLSRDKKKGYNSNDENDVSDIGDFSLIKIQANPKEEASSKTRSKTSGREMELRGSDTAEISSGLSSRRRTRHSNNTDSSSRQRDPSHQQLLQAWESRRQSRRSGTRQRNVEDFIHVSNVSRSNRRALPSHLRPDIECPTSSRRGRRLSLDTSLVVDDLGFVFECVDLTEKQKRRFRKHRENCWVEREHKKRALCSSQKKHKYYVCQSFSSIETTSPAIKRSWNSDDSLQSGIRFVKEEQTNMFMRDSPMSEVDDGHHQYTKSRCEIDSDNANECKYISNEMSGQHIKDADKCAPPGCTETAIEEKTATTKIQFETSVCRKKTDFENDLISLKKDVDHLSGVSESLLAERREQKQSTPSKRENLGNNFSHRDDLVHENHSASSLYLSKPLRDVNMSKEYVEQERSSQNETERSSQTTRADSKIKATTVGIYKGNVKVFTTPGGSEWIKHDAEKSDGHEWRKNDVEKSVAFEHPENVRYIETFDRKRTVVKSSSTLYTSSGHSNHSTAGGEILEEIKTIVFDNTKPLVKQCNGFCDPPSHNDLLNESLNDNRCSSRIQGHSSDRSHQFDRRIRQRTHSVSLRANDKIQGSANDKRRFYNSRCIDMENDPECYEKNQNYSINFIDTFDQMIIPEQPVPIISKEIGYSKQFIQGCMSRLSENSTSNNKSQKVFNKPPSQACHRSRKSPEESYIENEENLSSISKYSCKESSAKTSIHSDFKKENEMKYGSKKFHQNTVSFDLDSQDMTTRQRLPDNEDLFLSKNQNSSLCPPMNLSNFKRDVFYPQVAYNCSMSKRFSSSEENLFSTNAEGSHIKRKNKPHCNSEGDKKEKSQEADSGEDISLSSMSAHCGDGNHSRRFLLFSNNISSWQAWSKSWIGKSNRSSQDNNSLSDRSTAEIKTSNSHSCTISENKPKKSKRCSLIKTRNDSVSQRSKSMPRQYIGELQSKKHVKKKTKSIKSIKPSRLSVQSEVISSMDNSQISSLESYTSVVQDENTINNETIVVAQTNKTLTVVPKTSTQDNSNASYDSIVVESVKECVSSQKNKQEHSYANVMEDFTRSVDNIQSEIQFSFSDMNSASLSMEDNTICYSSGTDCTSPVKSVKRYRFRPEDAEANLSTNRCDSRMDTSDYKKENRCEDTSLTLGEFTEANSKLNQRHAGEKPTVSLNSHSSPARVANVTGATLASSVDFNGSSDDDGDCDGIAVSCYSNTAENSLIDIDPPSVRSLLDGKLKIVYDEESNKWFPGSNPNQNYRTRPDVSSSCKYTNDRLGEYNMRKTNINIDYDSAPGRIQSTRGTQGKDCSFYAWVKERVSKDLNSYSHTDDQNFGRILPKFFKRNIQDRNMSKSEDESSENESFVHNSSKFRKRRKDFLRNGRNLHSRSRRRGSNITLSTTSLMSHLSQSLRDATPEIFEINYENYNEILNEEYAYHFEEKDISKNKHIRVPVNSFSNMMGIGRLVNKMPIKSPEYIKELSPEPRNVPRAFSEENASESFKQILEPIIEESNSDQNNDNVEKYSSESEATKNYLNKYSNLTFNEGCKTENLTQCPDDFKCDCLIPNEKDRSSNKSFFANIFTKSSKPSEKVDLQCVNDSESVNAADCSAPDSSKFSKSFFVDIFTKSSKPSEKVGLQCVNDSESVNAADCSAPDSSKFHDTQEYHHRVNFQLDENLSPKSENGRSSNIQNEREYKSDFMKHDVHDHPKSFTNQNRHVFECSGVKNPPSMYLGGYIDSKRTSPDSYYYNPWTTKHKTSYTSSDLRYRSLQSDNARLYSRRYTQSTYRNPGSSFSTSFNSRFKPQSSTFSKYNYSGNHLNLNRTYNCASDSIRPRYSSEPIQGIYSTDSFASRNCNQNANNGEDHAAKNTGANIGTSSKSQTSTCSEFKWDQTLRKDIKIFQTSLPGKRDSVQVTACKPLRYAGSTGIATAGINEGYAMAGISEGYAMSNKFALCAGKNINGSGNMVGSIPHYGQVSQSLGYPVSATELGMARVDDVTPPQDGMCEIDALSDTLVVEPCSGFEASGGRDVTCNHPSTSSRYIGVPRNVSRDDIRMKLSPCCPHNDVYRKQPDHPRPSYHEGHRYKYTDTFRKIKENYMVGSQTCVAVPSTQGLDIRRGFGGQGDTHSKRGFTEWYVTDERVGDPGIPVDVQPIRERSASPLAHKSSHSSEGSIGSMESFSSSTCSSNCSMRDVEERAEDDDIDDSKESSEYEFDDIEQIEVEEDGSEVDDDEWEDDSDEELEEAGPRCCAVSYAVMSSREARNAVKDMATMKLSVCHNCGCDGQDMTHNKHDSMVDIDPSEKLRHEIVKLCKDRGEPHNQEKPRKEQESKAYSNHRYEEKDQFPKAKARSKSLSKKFSFDQIKVPSIEKERVRFACSEKGEWAEIGRGSYGCVYLGLLDGSVEVAIKDFYESSSWDLVIHEARMLLFLQETGITPAFYGLRRRFNETKEPSEYCIIMEYFGDGRTLFNVMSDKILLAPEEWLDVVGQLVAGLRLIHSKQVLINDLKADNILIDLSSGRKTIRYIDVGMATYKQGLTFQLPSDQMNKYNFLAPEVREGAHTSTKSDIYSLGYMLDQIMRLAGPALAGLDKLVARCLDKDPANRPDIDEIVSQVHWYIVTKSHTRDVSPRAQVFACNSV